MLLDCYFASLKSQRFDLCKSSVVKFLLLGSRGKLLVFVGTILNCSRVCFDIVVRHYISVFVILTIVTEAREYTETKNAMVKKSGYKILQFRGMWLTLEVESWAEMIAT